VLLLDGQDLAPVAEDSGEVSLDEEAVIVAAVDVPVPSPPLARVVFELRAEDREVEVSARLQESQHGVEIGRPVGLPDVVETAIVHQQVEGVRLDWGQEGIANEEPDAACEARLARSRRDRLQRRKEIVKAHGGESDLGKEECVSSFAASEVQDSPAPHASLEQARDLDHRRRRLCRRPGVGPPASYTR
jgi:hypothetical protein